MLITTYVPGPYSGVSQAPPQDRLPDACDAMEDCTATIPNGVQKRPPFRVLTSVSTPAVIGPQPLLHDLPVGTPATDVTLLISRQAYPAQITPYLFRTATGAPIALTITPAAQAYLNRNTPQSPNQDFRAASIEDYTFISNRTVQVRNGSAAAPTRPPEALVWCKTAQYGRTFLVTVTPTGGNPVTTSYRTPEGGASTDANYVGTDQIVQCLLTGQYRPGQNSNLNGALITGPGLNSLSGQGFTIVGQGSTIYLSNAAGFTIVTTDDQGSTAMYAIKGSVQAFSSLPEVGYDGMVVQIAQSAAGQNSGYYVQYSANGTQPAGGLWKECLAPGAPLGVDPTTLPIAITHNEVTDTWTCDAAPWTGRTTGDASLSPDPGFIGDYITDVRWWRGRLALIYNGGAVLSASDSPFKFYTTTLATDLDSDFIGLLSPADRKTFFKQAVTFDQRFFIFADKVQAAVSTGGAVVTPSSTICTLMAESAFSDLAPAQRASHKLRYLAATSTASILYQLAIDRLSGLALEEPRSDAIPQYLPPNIDVASTWEAEFMTAYAASGTSRIYWNIYREKDFQSVQNAFYRWNLSGGYSVGGFFFKSNLLYALLISSTGQGLWCTVDVSPDAIPQGLDGQLSTYPICLDYLQDNSMIYPTLAPSTVTYPLGSMPVGVPYMVLLRRPWNGYPEGYIVPILSQAPGSVTIDRTWLGAALWFGVSYFSSFIPTRWYYVGQDKKPQHLGRLSIRRLKVDIAGYGYVRVTVAVKGRATRTLEYQGIFQDDTNTQVDTPQNSPTAVLSVPIGGNAEDTQVQFISDSHLGFKLLGYEWTGDWNPRSRRVT